MIPTWAIVLDYILGTIMWTLIGRAFMNIFQREDSTFFFMRVFVKYTNPIINLFKFLRELKLISNYYSVSINKNIPVFGGLGGGTGNAASILKVLLKGKISKSLLNKAESIIGTDLRLFFWNQGFLSNLKNITYFRKKKLFFILVKPNIRCSTKEIYSKVRKYSKKQLLSQNKINTKNKSFISLSFI